MGKLFMVEPSSVWVATIIEAIDFIKQGWHFVAMQNSIFGLGYYLVNPKYL